MKKLNNFESFTAWDIQQAKPEDVWKLIKVAIAKSDKIFLNEDIDGIGEPDYITHIPYSNGFIEERFKYSLTKGLKDFLLQKCQGNIFYDFFLEHYCCEFYKAKVLIASMNLPKGILTINTAIHGMEYEEEATDTNTNHIEILPQL